MSHHCRCRTCGTRRALRKPLTQYLRPPKCYSCRGDLRSDAWMNKRNTKAMTCICSGHGRGFHYPHRRGSLWCNYQTNGEWKSLNDFKREAHLLDQEFPVEPHEPQDTVPINDINQFAGLVSHWHQNRVAQLRAVLETPDDVEIAVQNEQGEEVALNAAQRVGLQAGIYIALDLLGTLPFVAEMEATAEEPSNDTSN